MSQKRSLKLYQIWEAIDHDMTKRVMSQDQCQIEPVFMGFLDVYYHLSKIIPRHWTILDLGCGYAAQCWYFRNHKKYIGVDSTTAVRFCLSNSRMYFCPIVEFFKEIKWHNLNLEQTFGIMSYVPAEDYSYFTAKTQLTNLFIYYAACDPVKIKKINLSGRPSQGG